MNMKSVVHLTGVVSCVICLGLLSNCGGASSQQSLQQLTIAPAALPNGTSETPYSQTIQASGGVAPFTWTVSAGALPHNLALSTSATNTVTISGTPDTAAQGVTFTVKVTDTAGQSATQIYIVSILLEPDTLTLEPAVLNFAPQLVGTASVAQTETITNTGSSEVALSSIALTGTDATDFGQNGCGSSVAAAANCSISVTFTPSQLGPRSASIIITDSTVGSPHSVSLSGVGLTSGPSATLSATSLAFGAQTIGFGGTPQSVTLTNYGMATLTIVSIATSADFSDSTTCGSALASGATCDVSVTFTPSQTGGVNGAITITENAAGTPQTISLSGTGVAGKCVSKGQQCRPGTACCAGLSCVAIGLRGACE
jgi:hypothetical protein